MAVVNIEIGSRNYTLSCADGEESHLTKLAKEVDKKVQEIGEAVGNGTSDGLLLAMATLMMQDEINEFKASGGGAGGESKGGYTDESVIDAIDAIADYVETIADRIEKS